MGVFQNLDGRIELVQPAELDYIVPTATEMYSEVTNLVPFLSSNSGGRAILGTAQMVQAVPLRDPEVPLVRANNFESAKAFRLGMEAPVTGRVVRVTKDLIKLKGDISGKVHNVSLYNNMPLNRGGFLDAKPLVKKGDRVIKGQLLADSNQSRGGEVSLGRNLITAIMPYYGHNYEDGTVISESAAKKLTSEHIYDLSQILNANATTSAGRFTTYGKRYKIDAENWAQLDKETGLIKPGSVVKKGNMPAQVILGRELY